MSTSYSNPGGTGDRTAIITVTEFSSNGGHITAGSVDPNYWVDGSLTGQNTYWATHADLSTETSWVQFDFGTPKIIDEVKYYQQINNTATEGTWQWQGSSDASAWTNIGSTFFIDPDDATGIMVITSMAGSTAPYRYFRMLGVSGSTSNSPWVYEFEFKIGVADRPSFRPKLRPRPFAPGLAR